MSGSVTALAVFKGGVATKKDLHHSIVSYGLIGIVILLNSGFFIFNYAISLDMVSIVAPVSNMHPSVSVLLALVFLKDARISREACMSL